ncbi:MAG TPA: type II toxin-antitoxin system RelE/ParE family toxin [Tepidisphaeraceae bacterium]|jgi:phage-related protein|nr:type II toxin-antitoxin system RelE/ParE family toxin [Tepidisphaeraceae bacterium]
MPEQADKPLVILHGEIKSPPLSIDARRKAGFLLRMLQQGEMLSLPESRPMPAIGSGCHELRIRDSGTRLSWRIIYRIDDDAIVIANVFAKKSQQTPIEAIARSRKRLRQYDIDRRSS